MSTDITRALIDALKRARSYVREASECPAYGFFPGGGADPRRFTPDGENSDEELAAHKAACEAWDRGERPEVKRSGRVEHVDIQAGPDGAGGTTEPIAGLAIVCGSSYGIGTYVYADDAAVECLAQIDSALRAAGESPGTS